jgi:hypothetical protein
MTTVVELRQRYLFKTAQCIQVLTDWMASSFLPSFLPSRHVPTAARQLEAIIG